MGLGWNMEEEGLASSPNLQDMPPSPAVCLDHWVTGPLNVHLSLPFLSLQTLGGRVLGSLGLGAHILWGPRWLRLSGHGLLGLIPVFAGLLELVPPCHLSLQIFQVFLAKWKDGGKGTV